MSHQNLIPTAIASRHVHQALFLMLALIVTLLVAQQFQRWNDTRAAAITTAHASAGHHFAPVKAQPSVERAPALQQVERRVAEDATQPHWVF
jgi:hypothetical protein